MAYNKARAEKEWLAWKGKEEAQLRKLGVDEDTIQRLHVYDWAVFNSDRRFYEPLIEWDGWLHKLTADPEKPSVQNVQSLLDDLENQELYNILSSVSPTTLKILFLKVSGYSTKEISQRIGLSPKAINLRIQRLRKKLKNIWKE